jgi:predicted 3-demethylubiquinone-9 3-methyltransferase (glyoxalase superfamily)
MGGKVLTGIFEVDGYRMMAIDGGPYFTFTPSNSISVQCKDVEEIDALYAALSVGGTDLMPFQEYDFSKKYAWFNDKFGLSWQLNIPTDYGSLKNRFAEFKMLHGANSGKAEEAMNFYASIFPDSRVGAIWRHEENERGMVEGTVSHGEYTLMGQEFMAMDGGTVHQFDTSGALSLLVQCDSQEEIDAYWNALSADPASEQCGWCKDTYGFTWQIVPDMSRWLGEESEGADRAMQAMLKMKKIDIQKLEDAYAGKEE